MSFNNANEDLRIMKTKKALYAAIFSLLQNHNFKKITIKEICEEALISRATFYTHFIDKYDLLKNWMAESCPIDPNSSDTYEQFEETVNHYIRESRIMLKNLAYEADDETYGILFDFVLSFINLTVGKNNEEAYLENIVLSNFYAGGFISYLLWQINNNFPSSVPPMNRCLYKMLQDIQDCK